MVRFRSCLLALADTTEVRALIGHHLAYTCMSSIDSINGKHLLLEISFISRISSAKTENLIHKYIQIGFTNLGTPKILNIALKFSHAYHRKRLALRGQNLKGSVSVESSRSKQPHPLRRALPLHSVSFRHHHARARTCRSLQTQRFLVHTQWHPIFANNSPFA